MGSQRARHDWATNSTSFKVRKLRAVPQVRELEPTVLVERTFKFELSKTIQIRLILIL